MREGASLIPAYAPEWTNHNPSDPGITLLELLAYFSEILAYRALRITPDAKLHFLRLLEGSVPRIKGTIAFPSDVLIGAPSSAIDEAIRARVEALSSMECAVTPADFERFAVDAAATYRVARPGLRAKCMPGMDLRRVLGTQDPTAADVTADVSVVLALERELPGDVAADLCRHVEEALAPRCLLTTRAHVVRAPPLHLYVSCRLSPEPGVPLSVAAAAVDAALRRRFDPMQSDEPLAETSLFGRPLHLATVAAVIDRAEGVDYVENVIVLGMSMDGTTDGEESIGWYTHRRGSTAGPGHAAWRIGQRQNAQTANGSYGRGRDCPGATVGAGPRAVGSQ